MRYIAKAISLVSLILWISIAVKYWSVDFTENPAMVVIGILVSLILYVVNDDWKGGE